jgi:hypothetical protein
MQLNQLGQLAEQSCCSFEIHKTHADFAWQFLFHDHIIRNNTEFERIQDYNSQQPQKLERR